jgi:MFS family permease
MKRLRLPVPALMLGVGQAVAWAGLYYLFPALMLSWENQEGWARVDTTLVFSLAVIASSLASPLMGVIIDRGGASWLLAGSAAVGGVLLLVLAALASWPAFFAVWILIGLSMAGALYEPCFAIIVRYAGASAQRLITTVTLIAGFASTLAFPVAISVAANFGWRYAAAIAGVAVLGLAAPLLWFGVRRLQAGAVDAPAAPEGPGRPGSDTPEAQAVLRRPALWLLAAAFSLFALVHAGVLNHLLPILAEQRIDAGLAVLAASLLGPMQVVGRLGMMLLQRRLPPIQLTGWVFVALAVAALALLFARTAPGLLVVFVVLQGVSVGLSSILKPVVTAALLGTRSFGAVTGAMAVPFLAAFALAPVLASVVWLAFGYDAMLGGSAAAALAGFVLYRLAVSAAKS